MLKKQYRLTKNFAFSATYKQKNSSANDYCVLYAGRKKTDPQWFTRVGFVISKKIHKSAVKRNRIKRLFRESYRLALNANEIESSQKFLSLVFVIKSKCLEADFKTIYDKTTSLLKKLL